MQLVRHQGASENLAGLFLILLSQKQALMDHSPFPFPHPPAITTLPWELKTGLDPWSFPPLIHLQ